jgi:hypothetical protein
MSFEPNPENERKLSIILEMMRATPLQSVLTYQSMRERLNEPVASQHTAMRRALEYAKRERMVFSNVPGVGYMRLSDSQTATTAVRRHLGKVYRAASRGLRTAAAVANPLSLSQGDRTTWYAQRAVLESVKSHAHGNAVNARVEDTAKEPSALERTMARIAGTG